MTTRHRQHKRPLGAHLRWRLTETGSLAHPLLPDGSASFCGIPEHRLMAKAIRAPDGLRLGCSRCYGRMAVEEEWKSLTVAQRAAVVGVTDARKEWIERKT